MPVQALVVDDDITLRTTLVLQLDKIGVKADSAYNGIEALRRIHHWQYSIIFMDLVMPDMDGYETTAAIRTYEEKHNLPRTPIIAISALAEDEAVITSGMDAFIPKPVLLDELESITQRWMAPVTGDRHR